MSHGRQPIFWLSQPERKMLFGTTKIFWPEKQDALLNSALFFTQ